MQGAAPAGEPEAAEPAEAMLFFLREKVRASQLFLRGRVVPCWLRSGWLITR